MKNLMIGNAAVARGAYEAGVKVVSSYPGTPSTEITEEIAKYDEVYAEWAPNEKVAAEVAIGAAVGGARAMTCMKHVGLNVAADPLFTASYTGVNAGLVVCVADDPGMHSSQNEQDSRRVAISSKIPMLEPSDSLECKEYTKAAFDLSEKFDTPIFVRLSTRVSHSQSLVETVDRQEIELKPYEKNPQKYIMMPAMAIKRHDFVEKRLADMREYAESCPLNTVEIKDTKIGIITAGSSYQYAKEVFPEASFLKLGLVFPLPLKLISDFAEKVDKIYVIEELEPVIEEHCKMLGIKVCGKEKLSLKGEFNAEILRQALLGETTDTFKTEAVPMRPPVMCAGCPHRGTYYTLKKLGLTVTGDIGCYTLGAVAPMSAVDTCVCMGASIGMAHGMEKARGKEFSKNTVAVIGDSTFMHSGITGLVNVVYNQSNATTLILDNSITGMTGHQENPTTGLTLKGTPTKQTNLIKLCEAIGIERIKVCDPFDLKGLETTIKEEIAADEPSVIIVQRPCALLKKKVEVKPALKVNTEKCRNCKMCMKLGCPAISATENGVKIDATQCNGCGLCTKVCPFGAIE